MNVYGLHSLVLLVVLLVTTLLVPILALVTPVTVEMALLVAVSSKLFRPNLFQVQLVCAAQILQCVSSSLRH